MRISSLEIFNIATNSIAKVNEGLVQTQEQMSTGRRVLTPADDPVAATKIMQLTEEIASIKQYQNNINIAENNLFLEESTLNSVSNLVQRVQELAVQAANTATLSLNEYQVLATEVDARIDELLNLVNTKNANGDYIFGGYKSTQEPFTGSPLTGFRYNGDDGQQFIKVANNTTVAATDSGKRAFVDIESSTNTVNTYASSANTSNPPLEMGIGRVVDQLEYDRFYPEDIIITFNADTNISPPGKNFTATERSTNRVILENEPYIAGREYNIKGVSFRMTGSPVSGIAATPATRVFGSESSLSFPQDFFTTPETFTMSVKGKSETFILDSVISSTADLSTVLNDSTNGNAQKLARLGLTVDAQGIQMPDGLNLTVSNGSATIDDVMGLDTQNGSTSTNGVQAQAGDRSFIDSSKKQDIITTFARFAEAMREYDGEIATRENLSDTVAQTLDNLANAQTSILDVTSTIGARMNTLTSTRELHFDSEVVNKEVLSDLRDLDYAEAATRLSQQSLILQAAQQSFIRVSQLTLFSQL